MNSFWRQELVNFYQMKQDCNVYAAVLQRLKNS